MYNIYVHIYNLGNINVEKSKEKYLFASLLRT